MEHHTTAALACLQHVDFDIPPASVCQSGRLVGQCGCRSREIFRSRQQQPQLAGGLGNLVRTVDERAAEGTRGNPKDSDSTASTGQAGGLFPKWEGNAASVTLPGFAGGRASRELGYSIKPDVVLATSLVLWRATLPPPFSHPQFHMQAVSPNLGFRILGSPPVAAPGTWLTNMPMFGEFFCAWMGVSGLTPF